jgi:hypothetical protein
MTAQSAFDEMIVIIGIFFGLVWYLISGVW